jgi:hypothetical protein
MNAAIASCFYSEAQAPTVQMIIGSRRSFFWILVASSSISVSLIKGSFLDVIVRRAG